MSSSFYRILYQTGSLTGTTWRSFLTLTLAVAVVEDTELVGVHMEPVNLAVLVLGVKSEPGIPVHRIAQTRVRCLLSDCDVPQMLASHILLHFLNGEARMEG